MILISIIIRDSITPSGDRFNLLTWIDLLLTRTLQQQNNTAVTQLVNAQALLLDTLVCDQDRKTISKSALVEVRRTIRQNATAIPTLIDAALSNAQTCTPSYRNAVLIGTIIDTSLRLKQKLTEQGQQMIVDAKSQLNEYYLKNIMSARTAAPVPVLDAFGDFVHSFVPEDVFTKEYVPVIEKIMLRSPEVALRGK